jgi:magnesium-transporting ATPase (P-type)
MGEVPAIVVGPGQQEETAWHALSTIEDVLQKLGSSEAGLTSAEAEARLAQYGLNALTPPKKKTFLQRLWIQVGRSLRRFIFRGRPLQAA